MGTEFTFPLALCKAQWRIWLHARELCETLGSNALRRGIEETRAEADAVMRAEDWQALAMTPMQAFWPWAVEPGRGRASCKPPASSAAPVHVADRRDVVHDALCTLHTALDAPRRKR